MNVGCSLVKMNNRVEHTQMRVTLLKILCILFQNFCGKPACFGIYGGIVLIADLKNDLVVLLFLSAVADMLVVIFNPPVRAFLFCVVFLQSLVEQFVIDLSDVGLGDDNVIFGAVFIDIFADKITIVVSYAVLSADATADCSFFDMGCSFLLKFKGWCGIMMETQILGGKYGNY